MRLCGRRHRRYTRPRDEARNTFEEVLQRSPTNAVAKRYVQMLNQ